MRTACFWPRCPLFPVFLQYTMLWTVANGAIGQQTFEAYAAYILVQHTNILTHSNLRPFAGNIEGFEDGASEDEGMMGGDLIYPMSSTRPTPCNPITLPTNLTLLNNSYHPPWPWFQPLPLPHGQWFLPLPSPRCCPCACPLTSRQERQQTERQ
jgi:hypothetical protein